MSALKRPGPELNPSSQAAPECPQEQSVPEARLSREGFSSRRPATSQRPSREMPQLGVALGFLPLSLPVQRPAAALCFIYTTTLLVFLVDPESKCSFKTGFSLGGSHTYLCSQFLPGLSAAVWSLYGPGLEGSHG